MTTEKRVAIIGVGYTIPRIATPEASYREMTFAAAVRAYNEAGMSPKDIGCFTACSEDFNEGVSIFDEYVPDQLGAPLKPVHTISGDGLQGLAAAYMQIMTGLFDTAVVEAHSKASNIVNHDNVLEFAMDPIFHRPLNIMPCTLAGLEMKRYLSESGNTLDNCADVVVKNMANALYNPGGAYGALISRQDVLNSPKVAEPLTGLQISGYSDVAIVLVLASEEKVKSLKLSAPPVWIKGLGWITETSWLETHDWVEAVYARDACQRAYKQANIKKPADEIDVFEIDDTFAYKELQHMESIGLCKRGEAGKLVSAGATSFEGDIPVNPSGGSLGTGNMLEASGLYKAVEIVKQLRGEAGRRQVKNAKKGLAFAWRGLPTTTGAAVVLEK
ncbi:MAG: acetyl-CoA acetyltransferase [Planctomycetes bacterium]|nr:acetyl-CoA acetyltransferase [Planctomycetota bacterium]